jgi:hypothetical protein
MPAAPTLECQPHILHEQLPQLASAWRHPAASDTLVSGACACTVPLAAFPIHAHLLCCRAFKAVVFVIDGLEAYVRASKQTLLYNVLDALSSSQVRVRPPKRGQEPPAISSHVCQVTSVMC